MNFIDQITSGNLSVRLAKDENEIMAAQKLRYEYLLLAFNQNHTKQSDDDENDKYCDHLIVIDNASNEIVGTYRLLSGTAKKQHNIRFFSAEEFVLGKLDETENVLELGRAVVKAEYRNTNVFKMLWTGLVEYCKKYDVRYLFGTASYFGTNPELYRNSFANYYYTSRLEPDFDTTAREPKCKLCAMSKDEINGGLARGETPSLIRAYISLGAKVASEAYIDKWFNCVDLLIVFDLQNLNRPILKRMFGIEF